MPEVAANVQPQVPPVPVSGGAVEMVSASDIDDEPIATDSEDPDFTMTTPTRRVVRSENASTTDTMYVGRSASITALVGEINRTSACKTDGCKGELKCTKVLLQGRGGTIVMSFKCTGCSNRDIQYNSALDNENSLSRALQVAFLFGGCHYSQYRRVMREGLSMFAVTSEVFFNTIKFMQPHVKAVLDRVCELGRQQMRDLPDGQLGSFKRAVTQGDCTWLTRGHYSQNATFTLRNHLTGALLYYRHLSQRTDLGCNKEEDSGSDSDSIDKSEEGEYKGTSKRAESYMAAIIFKTAKEEGMNIAFHWQDEDSSSSKCLLNVFPDCKMMVCAGHAARTFEKHVKRHTSAKTYTREQADDMFPHAPAPLVEKYFGKKKPKSRGKKNKEAAKEVPEADRPAPLVEKHFGKKKAKSRGKKNKEVAKEVPEADRPKEDEEVAMFKCECHGKNHKWTEPHCGCMREGFAKYVRNRFSSILTAASSDPGTFANKLTTFGKDHIRGNCDHAIKKVCSCGDCKEGSLKCEGKSCKGPHELGCTFHAAVFELECHEWAEDLIHPELGKGHTTVVESSHLILTKFRAKDMYLRETHYSMSTNLGLLDTCSLWLRDNVGSDYHWKLKLYEEMDLPILDGVEEVLSSSNRVKKRQQEYRKRPEVVRKAKRQKLFHFTTEQVQRSDWGDKLAESRGKQADAGYGDDLAMESSSLKRCKCSSTTHRRPTSKKCPLNSRLGKSAGATPVAADHGDSLTAYDDSLLSCDECMISDDDSDVLTYPPPCQCKNLPRHERCCKYNLRNIGKAARKTVPPLSSAAVNDDDAVIVSAIAASTVSLCNTPTQSYMDSIVRYLEIDPQTLGQPCSMPIECPNMDPHICLNVFADGNCMFRAIALLVTGSEETHLHLRSAIVKFMLHLDNALHVANMIGGSSQGDGDVAHRIIEDYVEEKQLEESGHWGTERSCSMQLLPCSR